MPRDRNWLGEAKRTKRRFGGHRTIKDKAKHSVGRGRKPSGTLKEWPVPTDRYYRR